MQPRCRLIGLTLRATVMSERATVDGLAERNEDVAGGLDYCFSPRLQGTWSLL